MKVAGGTASVPASTSIANGVCLNMVFIGEEMQDTLKINYPSATPTKIRRFVCMFCLGFIEIISLKAPGNYSASFWSNKLSILSLERPKPNTSMISDFLDPIETLFYGFNYTKRLP